MQHLLTDPDQLADYTNRFFTEVYPVDEDQSMQGQPYDLRYDQLPAVPASSTGSVQAANPDLHWQNFGQVMNNNPEQAWRYLSQMGPDTFRSKLLFLDNA